MEDITEDAGFGVYSHLGGATREVGMKSIQMQYPSGRELLGAYWGHLQGGGLVLEGTNNAVGERVVVEVEIRSLKQNYRLSADVVAVENQRSYLLFLPATGAVDQQVMINAAWADTNDVPQRKHRRIATQREVRYLVGGAASTGQLLDVSRGGCRIRGAAPLPIGATVHLEEAGGLEGRVRWTTRACESGIEFSAPPPSGVYLP